jgi:hypothetical protein
MKASTLRYCGPDSSSRGMFVSMGRQVRGGAVSEHNQGPSEKNPDVDIEVSDEDLETASGGFSPMAANQDGASGGAFGSAW